MFAAPPIMNLTVLRSPEIDRAARFYSSMGLLFSKHRHGSGPEHYTSCVNDFVFEIYPLGSGPSTTGARIGFSVDDVDSVVEMLQEAGGTLVSNPHDSEWGRRAVIKDPDGHTVELLTPPSRDIVVASSRTSTGVVSETHSHGMNPGELDRN
jgi:predicted enzyme related to lactoylglutathione lyase